MRRRAQPTSPGENRQIPGTGGPHIFVEPTDEPSLLIGRERNAGILHSQRIEDAGSQQGFEIAFRRARQNITEQADAQVRIAILTADFSGQFVGGEKTEQVRFGIIRIGIRDIGRAEIVGQARQTRILLRQISQSDLPAITPGHCGAFGKVTLDRIIEGNRSIEHHVGQQKPGENLRHRADLEQGSRIHARFVAGNRARVRRFHRTDDHFGAGSAGKPIGYGCPDGVVSRHFPIVREGGLFDLGGPFGGLAGAQGQRKLHSCLAEHALPDFGLGIPRARIGCPYSGYGEG